MRYEEEDLEENYGDDPLAFFQGCAWAILISLVMVVVFGVVLSILLSSGSVPN